jgi:hypothetical protein
MLEVSEAGTILGFKYSHLNSSRSMRDTGVVPWELVFVSLFLRTKMGGGAVNGPKFSSLYLKIRKSLLNIGIVLTKSSKMNLGFTTISFAVKYKFPHEELNLKL